VTSSLRLRSGARMRAIARPSSSPAALLDISLFLVIDDETGAGSTSEPHRGVGLLTPLLSPEFIMFPGRVMVSNAFRRETSMPQKPCFSIEAPHRRSHGLEADDGNAHSIPFSRDA
jgi:hypothetical protein